MPVNFLKDTMTNFEKVKEFHRVYNLDIKTTPALASLKTRNLRLDLIAEECGELIKALADDDLVGVADALTDLLYVTYGMGLCYGIDLDACFQEVHASNMTKLGEDGKPVYREDGKVIKGPNYKAPDLKKVLEVN